jgi:hypothetical protein
MAVITQVGRGALTSTAAAVLAATFAVYAALERTAWHHASDVDEECLRGLGEVPLCQLG